MRWYLFSNLQICISGSPSHLFTFIFWMDTVNIFNLREDVLEFQFVTTVTNGSPCIYLWSALAYFAFYKSCLDNSGSVQMLKYFSFLFCFLKLKLFLVSLLANIKIRQSNLLNLFTRFDFFTFRYLHVGVSIIIEISVIDAVLSNLC